VAADAVGNLYVGDNAGIQKRDTEGHWSVIAAGVGNGLGQVCCPTALAVDAADNLFVAGGGRIQKRDAQGQWSVIATQVALTLALAVDAAGNLYVAEGIDYNGVINDRIQKRDAQGQWSVIATAGTNAGQVINPRSLAVDAVGSLYVADQYYPNWRIQKRAVQGQWSVIAPPSTARSQGFYPGPLAVDTAGNLYVGEWFNGTLSRIQKRDAQANWSLIATTGQDPGQVDGPDALAMDAAGNLYVAEGLGTLERANGDLVIVGNNRIQKRDALRELVAHRHRRRRAHRIALSFRPSPLSFRHSGGSSWQPLCRGLGTVSDPEEGHARELDHPGNGR
jgi:hypothetical protein